MESEFAGLGLLRETVDGFGRAELAPDASVVAGFDASPGGEILERHDEFEQIVEGGARAGVENDLRVPAGDVARFEAACGDDGGARQAGGDAEEVGRLRAKVVDDAEVGEVGLRVGENFGGEAEFDEAFRL